MKALRSFIFWTLVYRFRKRITLIVLLLSVVLLSQWIYADVVEYLRLTEQVEYLHYILPAKWGIILFNISLSTYLVTTMFKKDEPDKNVKKAPVEKKKEKPNEELTEKERSFLTKKVRSQAEILMDR